MNYHCNQVEAIRVLLNGFLSARFDNIASLDPKIAKMTATTFFNDIMGPRLDLLMETGQKMEDGLFLRQAVMSASNDYLEFTDLAGKKIMIPGKGNLENYYQASKSKLKKALANGKAQKANDK